jgi:hypothetical protein
VLLAGCSPRDLEDLVVPCSGCGEFATGVSLGTRDWVESPDGMAADDLENRIRAARGIKRRASTESAAVGLDDDTATAEPAWSVDATRVSISADPIACRSCGEHLPITRRDLAAAHSQLSARDVRWLAGYVAMKETVVCGLRHPGVALHGDLGTFVTVDARPVFIPGQKLLDLVDKKLLSSKKLQTRLAGTSPCRLPAGELPVGVGPPEIRLEVELGIGLAEIAKSLRDHGRTPLRGVGTLRTATYQWDGDHGRLLYMDFDARVRADVAGRLAGSR